MKQQVHNHQTLKAELAGHPVSLLCVTGYHALSREWRAR